MSKVDKNIGLLRKLQAVLPRPSISFHQKLESIQYNASLAMTGPLEVRLERNFIKS